MTRVPVSSKTLRNAKASSKRILTSGGRGQTVRVEAVGGGHHCVTKHLTPILCVLLTVLKPRKSSLESFMSEILVIPEELILEGFYHLVIRKYNIKYGFSKVEKSISRWSNTFLNPFETFYEFYEFFYCIEFDI